MRLGDRLIQAMDEPILIDHHRFNVGASIGLALFPADGTQVDELLRNAEVAMVRAKLHARGSVQAYRPELTQAVQQRFELTHALRQANEAAQFRLEYQPQVRLSDGALIGAEALLRWRHPTRGPISPADFIPLAEETGLILPIGEWVLRTACLQIKALSDAIRTPLRLAVNLSPRQFTQPSLLEMVRHALDSADLLPEQLELEITEGVLMHDIDQTMHTLEALRDIGVHLAVDDFGTGHSSLSYLKKFRVGKLKIDQSFVRDLTEDAEDRAIVDAVIRMAAALGLETLAEGVETDGQLEFLRRHGCEAVQGYLFSRALPADAFAAFVLAQNPPVSAPSSLYA